MHKYTCCLHALAVPAKEPLKDKLFLLPNLEIHTYFVFEKKGTRSEYRIIHIFFEMYSSGPNNGVVLNKPVGWIFCSPSIVENPGLWKNFKF